MPICKRLLKTNRILDVLFKKAPWQSGQPLGALRQVLGGVLGVWVLQLDE